MIMIMVKVMIVTLQMIGVEGDGGDDDGYSKEDCTFPDIS